MSLFKLIDFTLNRLRNIEWVSKLCSVKICNLYFIYLLILPSHILPQQPKAQKLTLNVARE